MQNHAAMKLSLRLPFQCGWLIFGLLLISEQALPTIALPQKANCPICSQEVQSYNICSYGGYIYTWPSKFHYVFWPKTESFSITECTRCGFACFMEDFSNIPANRIQSIQGMLSEYKLPDETQAVSKKFSVMEQVYIILVRNDEFWGEFFRVKAFHLDRAGLKQEAQGARKEALIIVQRMIESPNNKNVRKELYYASGAMNYLLGEMEKAESDFRKSLSLTYRNPENEKDDENRFDAYLTAVAREYLENMGCPTPIPWSERFERYTHSIEGSEVGQYIVGYAVLFAILLLWWVVRLAEHFGAFFRNRFITTFTTLGLMAGICWGTNAFLILSPHPFYRWPAKGSTYFNEQFLVYPLHLTLLIGIIALVHVLLIDTIIKRYLLRDGWNQIISRWNIIKGRRDSIILLCILFAPVLISSFYHLTYVIHGLA